MNNVSESVRLIMEQKQIKSISESFGDYVVNESAKEIRAKLSEIERGDMIPVTTLGEAINMIAESGLSDNVQRMLVSRLLSAYNESEEMEVAAFDEAIETLGSIKFSGDPIKNQEYISLLKEMDNFVAHIVDLLEADFDIANDVLDIITKASKTAKKKDDIDKCISTCLNRFDAGNKKYNRDTYKKYYEKFVKFNRLSKTFNNRYSKITMEEKKVIDSKFDKILSTLYGDIIRDWFVFQAFNNKAVKTEKMNEAYMKLKEIDRDKTVELAERIINPLYNYIAKSWSNTVGNINYMRKILHIDLEDTLKWKIVHKLFKD